MIDFVVQHLTWGAREGGNDYRAGETELEGLGGIREAGMDRAGIVQEIIVRVASLGLEIAAAVIGG